MLTLTHENIMCSYYSAKWIVTFRERVAQGSREKGVVILDALDKYYAENRQ